MTFDLLDTVLPTEGRYCVLGIGRYAEQKFVETREEVTELAQELVDGKKDVYFGCAKFGELNNRTHANAKYFRALWLDIDCGPTKAVPDEKGRIKGYIDQQTGLEELQKFCTATGLPKPILVSSGNGVHAYWLLKETIAKNQWDALADRLEDLCLEHELIVDSSVFEASRVLRIPGTFNFKDITNPLPVEVINEDTPRFDYEELRELLGAPEPKEEKPDFIPRSLSPMMQALMKNKVKKFKTIMIKSVNGTGCNQLLHCYENQEFLEEPFWRSALSIAAFCIDKDKAVYKLSSRYPNYDPIETEKKVDYLIKTGGPHHCTTFEKHNPGGCDECPHKGKLKSPIMLGVEIEEAQDEPVEIRDENDVVNFFQIPDYPFPFFRGKNRGVYRQADKDEEEGATLVYEHDLWLVKRMKDPDLGEVVLFRLHLPQDGLREFTLTAGTICTKDELRKSLAQQGVVTSKKQYDSLAQYVIASLKNLQFEKKAEMMRTQFGWVDNDSKFVIGDREITKNGVFYSPPSHTTRDVAEKMIVKGSLEKWKEAFNMYARPGLEPHAFAALTAFGSPLLKFTGLEGAIINLIHPTSGSGKSTVLYMCNSVSGEPKGLTSMFKDTFNAKIHQIGVMNNVANTIDEITNLTGMEFSDLSYSISQGRGKNKMKGSSNELRINNTKWQGITLASSNASFYEKLGITKNSPDGEMMRLLEYKIEPTTIISTEEGKAMFDHQLRENFGHAMEPYAQFLVNNLEDVIDLLRKTQAKIDREVQFSARERFWSAVAACNITGGLIAKSLGLHEYDMKAVYAWLRDMLTQMREEIAPPTSSAAAIIGDFINTNIGHILVVKDALDARTNLAAAPTLEPKGELVIRYEPDTKHLYLSAGKFREFCVERQISYRSTLNELAKMGLFKDALNKRMAKGMQLDSPAVRALLFDVSGSELLQVGGNDDSGERPVSD